MKKKLESELVSIAHRILKLKGREDVLRMHEEARLLYEKLSVLKFAHENFDDDIPTIGNNSSFFDMLDTAFNNKISDNIEVEDKIYINLDDVVDDDISEPVMNKIKDMVEFMPEETKQQEEVDKIIESVVPKEETHKGELEDLTADFRDLPVFEPISKVQQQNGQEKKTLNDRIKSGGMSIGLNDKIAFIKHLFEGNATDYDRVISQLNTIQSFEDADRFIETIVKPDYNNWDGKEEFEERFKAIVEAKFS
ncbi:hypothetical protein EYD45_15630 [Hyunsoonleella flava]|uniref:Uncharacterized protein n=2 Tax=Pseudomonadati TaxID=3379134 RepID=A0A4Q9FBC8_9FLAO|nr:hypothetical protein [Hyunsoonleella flava]TBM99388.1 hypothetical protein EYD45_15630 [Hyunsoonleella flava]